MQQSQKKMQLPKISSQHVRTDVALYRYDVPNRCVLGKQVLGGLVRQHRGCNETGIAAGYKSFLIARTSQKWLVVSNFRLLRRAAQGS